MLSQSAKLMLFSLASLAGLFLLTLFFQSYYYRERVLPGLQIGAVPVGGVTRAELTSFLQAVGDRLVSHGFRFRFEADGVEKTFFLSPVVVTEGTAIELMAIDVEQSVAQLLAYGKADNWWQRTTAPLRSRWARPSVTLASVMIDSPRLRRELEEELARYEEPVREPRVEVTTIEPLVYRRISGVPGRVFLYDQVIEELQEAWSRLESADVRLERKTVAPRIQEADLEAILPRLPKVFAGGGLNLSYKDPVTRQTHEWAITPSRLADWITVQDANGIVAFGLGESAVKQYLEAVVSPVVAIEPRDAKFGIDEATGKVTEFQGSRPGREADFASAYQALNDIILQRARHDEGVGSTVSLLVKSIEPNLTTGEVNNFGISEVLGVGHSNFSGSPANRIKNIRHAVEKLNGVLVKPGEEFSALKFTGPFTEEDGYLPELVIKGDQLKPEVGGGLCQIGSTLFRMAMNGGMPISERRNHSLVVSYYNDLENGLPGTDATIYEPAPDFKFKNDTGQAMLIQTEMNVKTGDLFFTLWGASDGRKGWYDAPTVKRWIEPGETKEIPTTKIPVGERQCQHAFRGAEASFTYRRLLPDGTPEERVFASYYRPLPEICLVGVAADAICDPHEPCFKNLPQESVNKITLF